MYYFAYGSNMSSKRLNVRIPSATKFQNGKLLEHTLKFHKISKDGSGKCDILKIENSNDFVLGVVYEIDEDDLIKLDKIEGKGQGYDRKEVKIILDDGSKINAITYYATNTKESLLPYDWYLKHVICGAEENELENSYINFLKKTTTKVDENKDRENKELEIYNS